MDGYGAFTQIWLTAQVLTPFISLSVENVIVQRVAAGVEDAPRSAMGNALAITAVLAAICFALSATPLGPVLAQATMGSAGREPEWIAALALAAIGGPIAVGLGIPPGYAEISRCFRVTGRGAPLRRRWS